MSSVKVAITIDRQTLQRVDGLVSKKVFPNRSRAIQANGTQPAGLRVCQARPEVREGARGRRPGSGSGNMARVLRGEIRWADLNPVRGHEQAGLRPVLVLSHDVFNERSGTVIAVALSSQPQRAGFPLTHELQSARLPKRSWVKISQIRTLAAERIGAKLGRASPEELAHVIEGLNEIIN